ILLHATNNALALVMLAASARTPVPGKAAPQTPLDAELVACARGIRDPGLANALGSGHLPISLNSLAWSLAIEPNTPPSCLLKAVEAVDAALKQAPDRPAFLDTKATLWFRGGHIDEAIDLERAAADLSKDPFLYSQLDRFLRARQAGKQPIRLGDPAPPV